MRYVLSTHCTFSVVGSPSNRTGTRCGQSAQAPFLGPTTIRCSDTIYPICFLRCYHFVVGAIPHDLRSVFIEIFFNLTPDTRAHRRHRINYCRADRHFVIVKILVNIPENLSAMCRQQLSAISSRHAVPVGRLNLYYRNEIMDLFNKNINAPAAMTRHSFLQNGRSDDVLGMYRSTLNLTSPCSLNEPMEFFASAENLGFHVSIIA